MFPFVSTPAIELVKDAATGRRLCRLAVDGDTLVTESGLTGNARKRTAKSHPSEQAARNAWEKAFQSKLREDYAFVRSPAETPIGGVTLCAFASGAGAGTLLDFSLDGRRVVTVGSDAKLTRYHVEVIDVATGARRCVFERADASTQNFVHAVFFDATGESVYVAPREETLRVDIATGVATRISRFNEHVDACFNAFVVRPHADAARRRFVVFDKGTRVRVLDRADREVLSVCTDAPTTECRAARISPSGRLLAVYRASRGLAYPHDDASPDTTSVVDIWDVDAGTLRASLPMPTTLDAVGLSPDDATLLVTEYHAQGPVAYDVATGTERWRLRDEGVPDQAVRSYAWEFSPDGTQLAVGHDMTALYDVATLARADLEPAGLYRTPIVRFSEDGRLLASAEHNLCVVRRVR